MNDFEAIIYLIEMVSAINFEVDVLGGNWMMMGYRFFLDICIDVPYYVFLLRIYDFFWAMDWLGLCLSSYFF